MKGNFPLSALGISDAVARQWSNPHCARSGAPTLMSQPAFIYAATRENFTRLVLENSRRGLVLVDFWAPWVGPSLRQREMLVALAEEYRGRFLLVTVNTDEQKQIAGDYGVRSLPLCKLFRHGRVVETLHGVQPRADYREAVERHLGTPASPAQQAALRAWSQGEPEQALQILAQAAIEAPDDLELPLLMSKLLVQLERIDDAHALLSALPPEGRDQPRVARMLSHLEFLLTAAEAPPREEVEQALERDPEDLQARYQLAARALLADEFETAMQQLIEILRRDLGFRQGAARRGLQAVFDSLEKDDPRVKPYRAEFFRLAY